MDAPSLKPTSVITGGSGFLGSHLSDRLLKEGHRVIAIDNLITGNVANIEHLAGNPDFKFIRHDVTEYIFVPGKVDYVWHFASPASPIDYLKIPIPTLKVGSLGTHYHPDHVGGKMMGWNIEGISSLLERKEVPIHIQKSEMEWVTKTTGVSSSHLTAHEGGDVVQVGEIAITLLHTPGHTPGSQCFLVDGKLVSGDTLFLEGCGRTDLPGSNPEDMYDSLNMLAALPNDTIVYPGHRYSDPAFLAMGQVRETNYVFKPTSKEGWLQWFGQ